MAENGFSCLREKHIGSPRFQENVQRRDAEDRRLHPITQPRTSICDRIVLREAAKPLVNTNVHIPNSKVVRVIRIISGSADLWTIRSDSRKLFGICNVFIDSKFKSSIVEIHDSCARALSYENKSLFLKEEG